MELKRVEVKWIRMIVRLSLPVSFIQQCFLRTPGECYKSVYSNIKYIMDRILTKKISYFKLSEVKHFSTKTYVYWRFNMIICKEMQW